MKATIFALLVAAATACGDAGARWIDDAAAAHQSADALVRAGAPDRAASVLAEFVARAAPSSVAVQDRRVVLQDAYARLAALAMDAGTPDQALRYADAGLSLGEGRDVFASALRTMRGRAYEALGRNEEAVPDYEAAQEVAQELLDEALRDGGSQ